jgi:hypothetical protein
MKNKTPKEAVLAKLGRRCVFSKNMEQNFSRCVIPVVLSK